MTDPIITGHGPVGVHYHQFLVTDPGGPVAGEETDASQTGLVGITAGDATIHTGIHTGDVDVTVTAHGHEPAPDAGEWEEIAEISSTPPPAPSRSPLHDRPGRRSPPRGNRPRHLPAPRPRPRP
ncbi:hypothetical protein ACFQ3Z_46185 [Streptomyces nogalater]